MSERDESEFVLDSDEYARLLIERYGLALDVLDMLRAQKDHAAPADGATEGRPTRAQLLRIGEHLARRLAATAPGSPDGASAPTPASDGTVAPSDGGAADAARPRMLARLVAGIIADEEGDGSTGRQVREGDPLHGPALEEILAFLITTDEPAATPPANGPTEASEPHHVPGTPPVAGGSS